VVFVIAMLALAKFFESGGAQRTAQAVYKGAVHKTQNDRIAIAFHEHAGARLEAQFLAHPGRNDNSPFRAYNSRQVSHHSAR
jgi:hypothetical protein